MSSTSSFGHPGFAWGGGKVRFDAGACEDAAKEFFATMTGSRGGGSRRSGSSRSGRPSDPWSFMFGQAPWGAPPWGPPWAGGGPGHRGHRGHGRRHPKARRGDVRAAILSVLADQPMNGYQIIQEITERSHGVWKPSPGSVYPTLQQLEDEGLVEADDTAGRRVFTLTDAGRTYAAEHADELAAPWEAFESAADEEADDSLKPVLGQVAAAMWQVMAAGTQEQQDRARQALVELRRQLYAILNDDDVEEEDENEDEGGTP